MTTSISIKNIGKCYKMYPSRNARLKEWLLPLSGINHHDKWVLQNINLEVEQGEAVGIIGMNGAGKSTLLKIITGTTVPTTGNVEYHGSVAALLELGLGFHPDFTGRQNVYMSGQLLGYTNEEITDCMQQVENFAEIGEAIDEPVRTYSSGMQVRLAFSVATMKRPDILIVDEALSVGDTYFQHKSFNRIKEFRDKGTTLLLVSHDKAAIQAVCNRAILLDHGKMIKIGEPEEIMDYYNAMISENQGATIEQKKLETGSVQTISGTGEAHTKEIFLLNSSGQRAEIYKVGEKVDLHIKIVATKKVDELVCGFSIKNNLGIEAYGTNTFLNHIHINNVVPDEEMEVVFTFFLNIGVGNFSINTALTSGRTHLDGNYEWKEFGYVFQTINFDKPEFVGISWLDTKINIIREGINK
jgi:lipopolysaccharide transport system ATP-binding protein